MIELAAKVYRGEVVEALHFATVAVLDKNGKMTHYLGDSEQFFMTRSVVKPFQAMPLVMSGAADRFGFSPKQIAVTCASHVGSDEHREVVISNLEKAGNLAEHLQCGTHLPIYMTMDKLYPMQGEDKDPLRHNCSGKHSGFLALARFLGEDVANYLDPNSRTQQLVKKAVAEMCEYPVEEVKVAIDGCSAPVFAIPVKNLALGFKKLASGEGQTPEYAAAARRIREAMTAHPLMVSGEGRLDYDIKRSFPGNAVCKIGAEAIEGIGFADPPVGICVKILDGNQRALGPVCVEVFRQLGIIKNIDDYPHLMKYISPEIRNYRDLVTGKIVTDFKLRKV
ncbi:MAG: asparaginase [candidate division Zixibacteria bacterium]|nr:asparaginase [candidate division Zixibacteria bacterium]